LRAKPSPIILLGALLSGLTNCSNEQHRSSLPPLAPGQPDSDAAEPQVSLLPAERSARHPPLSSAAAITLDTTTTPFRRFLYDEESERLLLPGVCAFSSDRVTSCLPVPLEGPVRHDLVDTGSALEGELLKLLPFGGSHEVLAVWRQGSLVTVFHELDRGVDAGRVATLAVTVLNASERTVLRSDRVFIPVGADDRGDEAWSLQFIVRRFVTKGRLLLPVHHDGIRRTARDGGEDFFVDGRQGLRTVPGHTFISIDSERAKVLSPDIDFGQIVVAVWHGATTTALLQTELLPRQRHAHDRIQPSVIWITHITRGDAEEKHSYRFVLPDGPPNEAKTTGVIEQFVSDGTLTLSIDAWRTRCDSVRCPGLRRSRRATVHIDASGRFKLLSRRRWRTATTRGSEFWGFTTGGRRDRLVAVGRDGTHRSLMLLSPGETGTRIWPSPDGACIGTLERQAAASTLELACLDHAGRAKWRRPLEGKLLEGVASRDGWLYLWIGSDVDSGTNEEIVAITPDGTVSWRLPWPRQGERGFEIIPASEGKACIVDFDPDGGPAVTTCAHPAL
jgi:hypothetical protein